MKVVINKCWGGFSISKVAAEFMAKRGNKRAKAILSEDKKEWYGYLTLGSDKDGDYYVIEKQIRSDPDLVAAVEALGESANGELARLVIVTVPDDAKWYIENYYGMESVHQEHEVYG